MAPLLSRENNRVTLNAEAFAASSAITLVTPPVGGRIRVKAWSIAVGGAVAAVGLRFGSANIISSAPVLPAGLLGTVWQSVPEDEHIGSVDEALVVYGGATSATLHGHVTYEFV